MAIVSAASQARAHQKIVDTIAPHCDAIVAEAYLSVVFGVWLSTRIDCL